MVPFALAGCSGHVGSMLTAGTHVVEVGDGRRLVHVRGDTASSLPPAIVIAGGPGFAWDYLELPAALEDRLALLHVELAGTGDSSRRPTYSRARDVADVDAVRAHFGAPRVILVGHSYGGFVALEYALAHPQRVAALVLYDTAAASGDSLWADIRANMQARADAPWFARASAAFAAFSTATDDDELAATFRQAAPLYLHDYGADPARWDAWLARIRISLARSRAPDATFDVRSRLADVRAPALVLVGASDFVCSPAIASELARGLSDAELVVLEASGHFGHVEQPDAFAAAVLEFLDRRALAGATR
jgi:proline iminopeptidase